MQSELRLLIHVLSLCVGLSASAQAQNPCEWPAPFETFALGDESGIGGTGHQEPESGIGGTGRGDDESGIGGTGIYGTLTAFGSVCVNGLRVHYEADVAVEVNGARASAGDLALGQVVFLVAHSEDGALRTRRIEVWSAAVGRVLALDGEEGSIQLDGQLVMVGSGTSFAEGLAFATLAVGDVLNVSGLPNSSGYLVASRVEHAATDAREFAKAPAPEELLARSGVERVSIESYLGGVPERLDLAGMLIDLPARSAARPGLRVRATGRVTPSGVLRVDRPSRPSRPRSDVRPPTRPDTKPDADRATRPDRVERPQRPERPERPESIDRVERPAVKDVLR